MSQHIWEVVAQILKIKTRFKVVKMMKSQDSTYQLQEIRKSLSKRRCKSFSLSSMFTRVLSKILIDSVLYVFACSINSALFERHSKSAYDEFLVTTARVN